jgi:hypothetical protein
VLALKALLEDGRAAPDHDRKDPPRRKLPFVPPSARPPAGRRGSVRRGSEHGGGGNGLEVFRDFLATPSDARPQTPVEQSVASAARRRWSLVRASPASRIGDAAAADAAAAAVAAAAVASPPPFQRKLTRRMSAAVPGYGLAGHDPLGNTSGSKGGNSSGGGGNGQRWYKGHVVAELADQDSRALIQVVFLERGGGRHTSVE